MKASLLFLCASLVFGQTTRSNVTNGRVDSRPFGGDLKAQIAATSPAWFGYVVTTTGRHHDSCCWGGEGQYGCRLENGTSSASTTVAGPNTPIPLEGSDRIAVLIRVDSAGIGKIRMYSVLCPLDAGGLPFTWIDNVPARASLAFLENAVRNNSNEHVADGAIAAIAQHEDREADTVLTRLTQPSQPEKIREKAVFWLGAARGPSGVVVLKQLLSNDASEHVRDKAVFALSISKDPEGINAIIHAARTDKSPHVRSQALFWLAQKAGQRAASTIVDAIQNDPDTKVKEKAVFALSQLPKDEGIPKLIQVASDQRNPEVRKKAFFWLGQSGDPRALAFIESVLTK
jgi:HEAT repeats